MEQYLMSYRSTYAYLSLFCYTNGITAVTKGGDQVGLDSQT